MPDLFAGYLAVGRQANHGLRRELQHFRGLFCGQYYVV